MRENFKLRKMKVGLVSVVITMLYIMTNGEAEASENQKALSSNINVENQEKQNNVNQAVQPQNNTNETSKVPGNFVKLNDIKPGDTSIQGTTLPNQFILLTIDKKM